MEKWAIVIDAPTGKTKATIAVSLVDGVWQGEMTGKNGTGPMLDVVAEGNRLSWTTKIERPMPMKLKFKGMSDGDSISGSVKFGMFASGDFTGVRA